MLFTLGVGSATALTGCVITIIREDFPRIKQWQAAGIVSVLGFLFGLVYVTPVGLTSRGVLHDLTAGRPDILHVDTPDVRPTVGQRAGVGRRYLGRGPVGWRPADIPSTPSITHRSPYENLSNE